MQKCDLIKLQCNFIEISFLCERTPVNLLHIFGRSFYKNMLGKLLLLVTPKQPTSRLIANNSNFCILRTFFATFMEKR